MHCPVLQPVNDGFHRNITGQPVNLFILPLPPDHMAENSMQDLMKIEALHQNRIPLVYPSQPFRTIVKDQSVRTHYFRIRIWHKKQTAECHVQKTHL